MSATASIRDLRTRFPSLKALLELHGEVIVTDRGRPAYVLRVYQALPQKRPQPLDYWERLLRRQPRGLSGDQAKALDEADRGDR